MENINGTLNGNLTNGVLSGSVDTLQHIDGDLTQPFILHRYENDYNQLKNHPSINGQELVGDRPLSDFANVASLEYGTVEDFKARSGEVSVKNVLYVRTDYGGEGHPGISIGDGNAYIGDLPVIGDVNQDIIKHIADSAIHVSAKDRTNWDDKVTASLNGDTLVFTV